MDQMWALATINRQALTQACGFTHTTARSSWIWLSVMPPFAHLIGKPISSPNAMRRNLSVIFDGVDTEQFAFGAAIGAKSIL